MPVEIDLKVDTRALEAALKALPLKLRGPIMRTALQAGGDVMLDAMESLAPERTDEPTPDSRSLAPGMLKADLHTQIQLGKGGLPPRIKVGPSLLTSRVARWQNAGWNLTTHGRSKSSRKVIRAIPGKHFIEAAFDESAENAVDVFLETLANGLFDAEHGSEGEGHSNPSLNVDFG